MLLARVASRAPLAALTARAAVRVAPSSGVSAAMLHARLVASRAAAPATNLHARVAPSVSTVQASRGVAATGSVIPTRSAVATPYLVRSIQTTPSREINAAVADAQEHKSKVHGSYHWSFERILVLGFLPFYFYPLIAGPSAYADFFLSIALPVHAHFGFSSIVADYLPYRRVGALNYVATGILYAITILTMYGLYSFNTNDIGLTQLIANVWNARKNSSSAKN